MNRDKVVRGTDYTALALRASCLGKGYWQDEWVDEVVRGLGMYLGMVPGNRLSAGRVVKSLGATKLPLINRGTYIRTRGVDMLVEEFVLRHAAWQVVSLGAGSDTRPFRIAAGGGVYTEVDFDETVRVKAASVTSVLKLAARVGVECAGVYSDYAALPKSVHSEWYHLQAADLRQADSWPLLEAMFPQLDPAVPTLVLAECVLCYLAPGEADAVVSYFQRHLATGALVVYEPIGSASDVFSQVMAQNLLKQGIDMAGLFRYGTLQARKQGQLSLGFEHVQLAHMEWVYGHWVEAAEKNRVLRLEFLDEVEELNLLNQHYVLERAAWGGEPLLKQVFMD